jgi:hypothetical protein
MYSIVDKEIYKVIDALTSELLTTLSKEAFENVTHS